MNSLSFRICITCLISLGTMIGESYWAYTCADFGPTEYGRISYVDPDLLSNEAYRSFYRTVLQDHQSDQNYTLHPEFMNERDLLRKHREAENVADWSNYFGPDVPTEAIRSMIYESDTTIINMVIRHQTTGANFFPRDSIVDRGAWNPPDTIRHGTAYQNLIRYADPDFLRYLHFAWKCSHHSGQQDQWREHETESLAFQELVHQGLEHYRLTASRFLKARYAYQTIRMARYDDDFHKTIDLYDLLFVQPALTGPIRYWALNHVAGAEWSLGRYNEANFHFAVVFDSCEGERELAVRDFLRDYQCDWDTLYSMARNDHDRAILWMLRGFKSKGLEFGYIQKMFELEPDSPLLALALMRELHRIESFLYQNRVTDNYGRLKHGYYRRPRVLTAATDNSRSDWGWYSGMEFHIAPYDQDPWDTIYVISKEMWVSIESFVGELFPTWIIAGNDYVHAFRRFARAKAGSGKVLEPALWYMVAGYIDLMDQNQDEAAAMLDSALATVGSNYDLRQQILLLDHIRRTRDLQGPDDRLEQEFAGTLDWMAKQSRNHYHSKFSQVLANLGQQYLEMNDVPKAALIFNAAGYSKARNILIDIYATYTDLERLEKIVASGGSNAFERQLLDSFPLTPFHLQDIRATRMMRDGRIEDAVELYRQIPDSYWKEMTQSNEPEWYRYRYPREFYSSEDTTRFAGSNIISSWHPVEDSAAQYQVELTHSLLFNHRTFAERVGTLLDKADRNEIPRDLAYLKIGNLFYNTPFWGYNGILWEGSLHWSIPYSSGEYPFNLPVVSDRLEDNIEAFMERYGSRSQARRFYLACVSQNGDPERGAVAAYRADLCSRYPQTSRHKSHPYLAWAYLMSEAEILQKQDRTGYNLLLTRYRDTKFGKEILSSCSVYRYFAAR